MSNPISKQVIDKIVTILDKLQERLSRIGKESAQTRDTLAAFQDEYRLVLGGLRDELVQLKSADQTVLARIKEVGFENDKREEAQTLRDQNNVQALVGLRDSTKKAFDQVAGDVKSLLTAVQRLNERVGQVESQNNLIAIANRDNAKVVNNHGDRLKSIEIQTNANRLNVDELLKFKARTETNPSLSSDHVWVNKKLTSVYAVTEELEARIQKLETPAPPTQTPQPIAIPYLGYVVRVLNNSLYIGDEKFIFSDYIRDVRVQPYGVIVTLRQGNQYIVCGGPSPASMYVNLFKKA